MSTGDIIQVNGLSKQFGTVSALDNVSLTVHKGETLSLIGPSGCGKTTTLRNIAGLDHANGGEIFIDGKCVFSKEKKIFAEPEKRNIGMVFQSYALWPNMTIEKNIAFGLKARKFPSSEIKGRVKATLEKVGLPGIESRYPSQLSGGQQQRVALGRCLAYEPAIMLLDEPLSNLDLRERDRMRTELKKIVKASGITALYVTHDQEEAFTISDRVMIMNKGKIVQEGSAKEVYEKPMNAFVANFVGRSNMFDATIDGNHGSDTIVKVAGIDKELVAGSGSTKSGDCLVVIRPNEITLSMSMPRSAENVLEGRVNDRDYRGSITDYRVAVGDLEMSVTTHKFCLSQDTDDNSKVYLSIPKDAITVVSKSEN